MFAVPSGPPVSVRHSNLTSRSLSLQWEPPVTSQQNGFIRNYTVEIEGVDTAHRTSRISPSFSLTEWGLHPYTRYRCRVAAHTSVGRGPFSGYITVLTSEDGE